MKSFYLKGSRESYIYDELCKRLKKNRSSLIDQLTKVQKLSQEIEKNINDKELGSNLQHKIKLIQNLIHELEQAIRDKITISINSPNLNNSYESERSNHNDAFRLILDYLFDLKIYLLEANYSILLNPQETEIKLREGIDKHHIAIAKSLNPSLKSVASLFAPLLLKKIQRDPTLSTLNKEDIDHIVQESSQSLEEHLYTAEKNNVTASQFEGMRQHYVLMLEEYEELLNQFQSQKSEYERLRRENGGLIEKMKQENIQVQNQIESLQNQINDQNLALKGKEEIIERHKRTLETQSNQFSELKDLKEMIEFQKKQIDTLNRLVQISSKPNQIDNELIQNKSQALGSIATNKNAFHAIIDEPVNDQNKKSKKSIFGFHFHKH